MTSRPTIISASCWRSVSAGVVCPVTAPLRSTVMRSLSSSTSCSLWEMKIKPRPASGHLPAG